MKKPYNALDILVIVCLSFAGLVIVYHYWEAVKDSVGLIVILLIIWALTRKNDPPANGNGIEVNNEQTAQSEW